MFSVSAGYKRSLFLNQFSDSGFCVELIRNTRILLRRLIFVRRITWMAIKPAIAFVLSSATYEVHCSRLTTKDLCHYFYDLLVKREEIYF